MFTIRRITHTSTNKFTFALVEGEVGDASLYHLLDAPGVNKFNSLVQIVHKTDDKQEANDTLAKFAKENENNQFFIGLGKIESSESKPSSSKKSSTKTSKSPKKTVLKSTVTGSTDKS